MRFPSEVLEELQNRRTCRKCKLTNPPKAIKCRGCNYLNFRKFRLQLRKSS